MTERKYNPDSEACGQWETLLTDALDGLLQPADEAAFSAHLSICPACAALFEQAQKGREWLGFLCDEPEVPAGLFDKILAQTGPGQLARRNSEHGLAPVANIMPMPEPWQRPGFMGFVRRYAEPRLMMTAAMAFFSVAVTINMFGALLVSWHMTDLRPSALLMLPDVARSFVERRLVMVSTPIIRFHDNSRFINDVESTVREIKQSTRDEENQQQQPKQVVPGESKKTPQPANGEESAPEQSVSPARNDSNEFLETTLRIQARSAHPCGSAKETWERSSIWNA
jgi:hypothetical protein